MNAHRWISRFAVVGLLSTVGIAAGCNAEAGTSIGNRTVTARTSTALLGGVSVCGGGQSARLVVGLTAFDVTPQQVTWNHNRVLQLPADWKQLELVQSGRLISIRVDGKVVREVDPAA